MCSNTSLLGRVFRWIASLEILTKIFIKIQTIIRVIRKIAYRRVFDKVILVLSSIISSPKNSGQWKLGAGNRIGFQLR